MQKLTGTSRLSSCARGRLPAVHDRTLLARLPSPNGISISDPRVTNLAQTIVDYSTRIKAGDQVFIMASTAATPLVQELYRLAVQRGAHPLVMGELPGL